MIKNWYPKLPKPVRKAMVESQALAEEPRGIQAMNQVIRWIVTKEEHCDNIIHLMGDYCLCQRVKQASFPSEADYLLALKLHHNVMVAAMKAKQTMDLSACDALDHALEDVAKMYTS
jgi:Nickel-containing superoxide dismutase